MRKFLGDIPLKATEINYTFEEEVKNLKELVENPPEASEYVQDLMTKYQKRGDDRGLFNRSIAK